MHKLAFLEECDKIDCSYLVQLLSAQPIYTCIVHQNITTDKANLMALEFGFPLAIGELQSGWIFA